MKTEEAGEQQTRKPDAAFIKRVWPKLEKAAERAQPEKCPNCNRILHYYDGCLGYEAMRCNNCGYERDLNAAAAKATAEREARDKWASLIEACEMGSESGAEKVRELLRQRDELLESIKDLLAHHRVKDLPNTNTLTPRVERVRAAIAKAEGRAQ